MISRPEIGQISKIDIFLPVIHDDDEQDLIGHIIENQMELIIRRNFKALFEKCKRVFYFTNLLIKTHM